VLPVRIEAAHPNSLAGSLPAGAETEERACA